MSGIIDNNLNELQDMNKLNNINSILKDNEKEQKQINDNNDDDFDKQTMLSFVDLINKCETTDDEKTDNFIVKDECENNENEIEDEVKNAINDLSHNHESSDEFVQIIINPKHKTKLQIVYDPTVQPKNKKRRLN